jgi:hypothetical protein
MAFYFIKVVIYFLAKAIMALKFLQNWERGKKFVDYLGKGLFFSEVLAIIIDGYFEFGISLYLQA